MENILQVKNITMVYPTGVIANKDVSMDVRHNSIHALVGENGAGKSTLMNVIFGKIHPQEGDVLFKGEKVSFRNPNYAIKAGIGMVHQHLMLAPDLTVAENMILGIEPRKGKIFLDTANALEITREVSKKYGLDVPVDKKIKDLPIGVRQRVEILKALFRNAELLILDEPTAVLTPQETEVLFKTLFKLKERGKTILFISHKLSEVKQLADTVTVMRDTRVITTKSASELTEEKIAHLMVGRDINSARIPDPEKPGKVRMSVRGLEYIDEENIQILKDVNFDVRAGEILGIAGVEGNGQSELISILTGLLKPTEGSVSVDGTEVIGLNPRQIRELKVSHIPEDRMENGVADVAPLEENFISDRYYKPVFSNRGRINWKYIKEYSKDLIERFNILTQSSRTPAGALSGGNIQKVVVARELSSDPELIIAAQPTRGVDIGSEELIHDLLKDARDAGKAIFLISADLDEILKLSTRIIVIYDGQITNHFTDVSNISGVDLGPYMLGVKREEGSSGKIHS
ncbi:MAG: ABC transporter ATP-binding protein [Spirochaetales bacterium]|nr:ABC transporter ATP-binding protein [Spirochaetales bacterium]